MIDFYCGINDSVWNHHPVAPGPLGCVSPVYGASERTKRENRVTVPAGVRVIRDAGPFCDGPGERLEFPAALDRQLAHAARWGYADQVTHTASYDLLIDEVWTGGNRYKRRWSEAAAWEAVRETIDAAEYLSRHYAAPRILSAQGVTAAQYRECAARVLEWFDTDTDIFGLGGWCILGKMPSLMMPTFQETITQVIPLLARAGVKQVHIWGVLYAPGLGQLLYLCDQHGLKLSTDSAGPSMRPCNGVWGYADWYSEITPPPVEERGLRRAEHVQLVRDWLADFRQTQYYQAPVVEAKQLYFSF